MKSHIAFCLTALVGLIGCAAPAALPTPADVPAPTAVPTAALTRLPVITPTPTVTLVPAPTLTPAPIRVDLPPLDSISQVTESLLQMPWGEGVCQVGLRSFFPGQPLSGPNALALAPDGTLAVADAANFRVLLFPPPYKTCATVPVRNINDVAFDVSGRLIVSTYAYQPPDSDEEISASHRLVYTLAGILLYVLREDTDTLITLNADWCVEGEDGRIACKLDEGGNPVPVEGNQPVGFEPDVEVIDGVWFAQLVGRASGVTYEIGPIEDLYRRSYRTPTGYVLVLCGYQELYGRATWFDEAGEVTYDVSAPWSQGDANNWGPRDTVDTDGQGTVVWLSLSDNGAEVYRLSPPD